MPSRPCPRRSRRHCPPCWRNLAHLFPTAGSADLLCRLCDRAACRAAALVSSVGFALQYVALAQAGSSAGLWPVAAGRIASVMTMVVSIASSPRGLTLYLAATGHASMSVAVVLSSLYPVVPVLLGVVVLRERLAWWQVAGLAGAGGTVVLVTVG